MRLEFNEIRGNGFATNSLRQRDLNFKILKNSDSLRKRNRCPMCNTIINKATKILLRYDIVTMYICNTCKCAFDDLIPLNSCSGKYNIRDKSQLSEEQYEKTRKYRMAVMAKDRLEYMRKFVPKSLSECTLLDVGCNSGSFLEFVADYMKKVDGIEINNTLADAATCSTNCTIYCNDFTEFNSSIKYDFVTMFDFIEHVPNPLDLLLKAKSLLTDEGVIVIFTPNYNSLSFKTLGIENNLIGPSDHLQFLSIDTFKYLQRSHNLWIHDVRTIGLDMYDILANYRDIKQRQIKHLIEFDDLLWNIQTTLDNNSFSNHIRAIIS